MHLGSFLLCGVIAINGCATDETLELFVQTKETICYRTPQLASIPHLLTLDGCTRATHSSGASTGKWHKPLNSGSEVVVDTNKAFNTIKHFVTHFLAPSRTEKAFKGKAELRAATVDTNVCKSRTALFRDFYLKRGNDGARKSLLKSRLQGCLMQQGYSLRDTISLLHCKRLL